VKPPGDEDRPEPVQPRAYDPPAILWEEPYEDVVLAMYCARESGNPGCNPGPFTN
jgi:hypothetical protein